jgi:hypothetical protein
MQETLSEPLKTKVVKTNLLNEKNQIQIISLIQSGLMLITLLIVSPLITFCYETFKLDYHILEPSIALSVILVILFYEKKVLFLQKNYGELIPNIHKILHFLSVGTMLVFCIIDLFGNGRILMSEITLVFIVCIPVEIYITISNRNRIMAHLNHQNYKTISSFFVSIVLFICATSAGLLLGTHSNPILLITFSVLFTIPLFFIVLLGRELIV